MKAIGFLSDLLSRIRGVRFAFFALFLAVYVRGITMLQQSPSVWAEWVVGSLACVPGVFAAFLLFDVVATPRRDE